jgi:tetratricopeptide (TPR) repeat protein
MSRRRTALASSASAVPTAAPAGASIVQAPLAAPKTLGDSLMKDVASPEALRNLSAKMEGARLLAAAPLLRACVEELGRGRFAEAQKHALAAVEQDERLGYGWYLLAICREKQRDYTDALNCYERALALMPDEEHLSLTWPGGVAPEAYGHGRESSPAILTRKPDSLEGGQQPGPRFLPAASSKFTESIEMWDLHLRPAGRGEALTDLGRPSWRNRRDPAERSPSMTKRSG